MTGNRIADALKTLGELNIDIVGHRVLGKSLSKVQFGIIMTLVAAGDNVLSREEIAARTPIIVGSASRTVDVHILRIREAFNSRYGTGSDPIETVHGSGYRINSRFLEKLEDKDRTIKNKQK